MLLRQFGATVHIDVFPGLPGRTFMRSGFFVGSLTLLLTNLNMPPCGRGRGCGGRGQNTNPPQLVPPAATPIPTTSTPPPAAGCAADALHRPSRDRQPPVKFRDGGSDGETSDIQNVSGDKGGGGDPTPGIHALPSPLRTAIGTPQSDPLLTDPLLTGSGTTQSRDVHDLTHVSNDRRVCKFCE